MALRNLKGVCTNRRIDLFTLLSRHDSERNGLVPLERFRAVITEYKLVDNSASLMAIIRLIQKDSLNLVDINVLQIYLERAEDPSKFAYIEIMREMIVNHAGKTGTWLRKLYEQYSANRTMTPADMVNLLRTCDMKVVDDRKIETIMRDFHPTSQKAYMTIYDFLGMFPRNIVEPELVEMFKPYGWIYSDLQQKLAAIGTTISKHFERVTNLVVLAQEIDKLIGGQKETYSTDHLNKFCQMLEAPEQPQPKTLDKKALEFIETYLPKNLSSLVGPQGFSDKSKSQSSGIAGIPADPSGLTLEELEKVKVGITQIDGVMRKALNLDYIGAMQKYDPKKTGKVSDEDFYKFLEQDLKLNASKKKNTIEMLKKYAKQGKQGNMDYFHLWAIIGTDLSKKKSEATSDFKVETAAGDNSAPAVPNHLVAEKKDAGPGITPSLVEEIADAALKHPVRLQIIQTYKQLAISKDNFMNLLFPESVRELDKPKAIKIIMDLVKGLNLADVDYYLGVSQALNEHKYLQKDKFRKALFDEAGIQGELKDQTIDQQIQSVYNSFRTGKEGLTMNQVGDACKRLGIYLSKPELDQLFRDFKKKDSPDMSEGDFNKLVKHEFSKDVISSRVIGQRLSTLLNSVLVKREENLVQTQVKAIYDRVNAPISDPELQAIFSICTQNDQGGIDKENFFNLIVSGQTIFESDNAIQAHLGSAVMKLRTGLSSTIAEQISNFKDLPACFVPSFTEDLYNKTSAHLPTSTLKPTLGDTKSYYSNLYPPIAGQEANVQSRYTKYLKLTKSAAMFEIELSKATGVPIPSDQVLDRHCIVGRELRVFLFEENRSVFLGNCLNLKAKWSQEYEDRIYFDTYDLDKEDQLIIKVPAAELGAKEKRIYLMFELVMFVKRNDSRHANAMTAGFCKLDLLTVDSSKTLHLDLVTGSPHKEKSFNIAPNEVMHRRKGFMPTLASLFEGKIKSQLHLTVKPFKFNAASPTEFAEQVELLPDLGVYHVPQIKIHSCFRQCLGRDAFSFRGAVTANLNLNLSTEIYVNSYCAWFSMHSMAVVLSHFWNNTVTPYFAKDKYETKMDALKYVFVSLYAPLNSRDFGFEKSCPTNDHYGDEAKANERLQILRAEIEKVWSDIQSLYRAGQRPTAVRHLEPVAKLAERTVETTHSAFNVQELMDDDFGC